MNAIASSSKLLTVTFLDVGEGLCAVVKSPSGKVMVMDCGSSSWSNNETIGSKVVAPYLQRMGYDNIDIAVLSHPHSDHVSGFASLLKAKPAKIVLDIGAKHASPQYKQFLAEVKRSKATYRIARRGQTIDMGDGVNITVLNPDPQKQYTNLNDNSIGLRITYKKAAIVLAGDMGKEAEESVIESKTPLRAQVLQVGHHGSASSSSPEWLGAIRPKIAIISCGRHNIYRHPSREVIDRLHWTGTRIYRTDMHGAIDVITDGKTISIKTYKQSTDR